MQREKKRSKRLDIDAVVCEAGQNHSVVDRVQKMPRMEFGLYIIVYFTIGIWNLPC